MIFVESISRTTSKRPSVCSAKYLIAWSISALSARSRRLYFGLRQLPRKQVPDQLRRDPQPPTLGRVPEVRLRHGQAYELGVGDLRDSAECRPGESERRHEVISQLDVQCNQKGVQIGVHGFLAGGPGYLRRSWTPFVINRGPMPDPQPVRQAPESTI